MLGIFATQRMEPWWNDPDTFDPDRFAEPRREDKSHRYAWAPFGGGAHKCIGLHFGGMEVKAILHQMGEHLVSAGYKDLHVYDLKGRHVNALLRQWQAAALSPATQKNRMAVLRWWAAHIGKADMLKADNAAYGIAKRQIMPTGSKARQLTPEHLSRVQNAHGRMSLELQRAFGLRRQEAIKIKPHQADQGAALVLQGSWCKGGQGRSIPILTAAQREVLEQAKALARFQGASLIPKGKTYAQQLHSYEGHCRRANLDKMHGLRHAYAQERFAALAGFLAPAAGGPSRGQPIPFSRLRDRETSNGGSFRGGCAQRRTVSFCRPRREQRRHGWIAAGGPAQLPFFGTHFWFASVEIAACDIVLLLQRRSRGHIVREF